MFAVIKTGGKQYKVAADNEITVMALEGDAGAQVTFDEVLALFDGEKSQIGAPHVVGARVLGEIVEQTRGPKVIAFKKRRRKNSRRKHGHKQDLTIVRITQILASGAKAAPAKSAAAPAQTEAAQLAAGTHHAAAEAAKAAGLDTSKFQKLDKAFGQPDDLTWIHGVGPGIAKKLHGAGVFHFWQVAALTDDDIAAVEHEVGFSGRAKRDQWKSQAADLMAGKAPVPKTGHHHDDHEG
ncbi:MAG: 50S ribosomal protein L21 [Roseiarcus sp.]